LLEDERNADVLRMAFRSKNPLHACAAAPALRHCLPDDEILRMVLTIFPKLPWVQSR
jgi:hypothetical protein